MTRDSVVGGFVAGTRVRTKEGLKPIEEIEVGDLVLSRPENGEGDACFQPVTRTFRFEQKELFYVQMMRVDEDGLPLPKSEWECIAVTGGHPVWVSEYRQKTLGVEEKQIRSLVNSWMSVKDIYIQTQRVEDSYDCADWGDPDSVLSPPEFYGVHADGGRVRLSCPMPILRSPVDGEGVCFSDAPHWSDGCSGTTLRFGSEGVLRRAPLRTNLGDAENCGYDYSGYDVDSEWSVVRRSAGHLPMRRTVFNIEVENSHTYYVGEAAVWVHNTHCGAEEAG